MSKIRVEMKEFVACPVWEAFARATDLDHFEEWMPRRGVFKSSRQTSPGPMAVGTPFTDHGRMGTFDGEVLEYARELAAKRGVGVLAVLHDLNLAAQYADRIFLLKQARVVASGAPEAVLSPTFLPVGQRAHSRREVRAAEEAWRQERWSRPRSRR